MCLRHLTFDIILKSIVEVNKFRYWKLLKIKIHASVNVFKPKFKKTMKHALINIDYIKCTKPSSWQYSIFHILLLFIKIRKTIFFFWKKPKTSGYGHNEKKKFVIFHIYMHIY